MEGDAGNGFAQIIADKVILLVVNAIVREFGYLFSYKSNIKNLKRNATQLENSKNDADIFFKAHEQNSEEVAHSSAAWLKDVQEVIKAAKEIEEATAKFKGCLNLKDRHVLSRKSTKLAAEIRTLQYHSAKGIIVNPAPPAGRLPGASSNFASMGYKTRMEAMNEVMKAMEDHVINVIGICGLGGVGKTTLVHEVRERARKQNLFDEVAMTRVSQKQDIFKIQDDLAEMLGFTSLKEKKNDCGRSDQLHKRLSNGNKILIILDDVWSDIKLEDIGIPYGSNHKGCKVVITSRHENVCTGIQKNIKLELLPQEEARAMFRKAAGDCVERHNLEEIADEVADECGGLPIALLTLSRALSNKDRRVWEDARTQLREGSVTNIDGMKKEVYQSIELSYDFLAFEKQEAQSLLLLCCQHPKDVDIKVEKLVRYCLSLELFQGVSEVVQARNRVYSLIAHLKSCFLLQAVDVDDVVKEWKDETVKVHDVVRDVCASIVSRGKEGNDKAYMHIMAGDTDQLGTRAVNYPKLKLLVQAPLDGGLLSINFLQGMEELRVLESSSGGESLPPPALQALKNLRLLSLDNGDFPKESMSMMGSLTNLEILSFWGSSIGSLPRQIGQLSNLKLLDLRCRQAKPVPMPSGIFPGLNKLEELYMGSYCFLETPKEGTSVESNGHLSELDFLFNLRTFQTWLRNPMGLLDLQCFDFEKLERFFFRWHGRLNRGYPLVKNTLDLENVGMEWVLGAKIQPIVERTVDLSLLRIDWGDAFLLRKFGNLRFLCISYCNDLKSIIHGDGSMSSGGGSISSSSSNTFHNLERLTISNMKSLRELCHSGNLQAGSLGKLQYLYMADLPKMRHLWVGRTDPMCLINLKHVIIRNCGVLECIFPKSAAKCLPKLQELRVENCGMLEGIVSKGEGTAIGRGEIKDEPIDLPFHFPKLRKLTIESAPKLRGFYNPHDDNGMVRHLLNTLVLLPSMEELKVEGLDQLKQIIGGEMLDVPTFAASDWLQNLERIAVKWCNSLESVFDFEGQQNGPAAALHKLKEINLSWLSNITHIFRCRVQDISVPELETIHVVECDNLVNIFASVSIKHLRNLKHVNLDACKSIRAVFDFEGLDVMREDAHSVLGGMENISLKWLSNLEHVFRLVPKEIRVFQNLKTLIVENCGSLVYLIPSSLARMLVNLQELIVKSCMGMNEVCKLNECGEEKKNVFCSLKRVTLEDLKNLSSFCSSNQQLFGFQSLERVTVIRCPKMETFYCPKLRVACCGMLEGNVSKREGRTVRSGGREEGPNDLVVQFPELKEIILRDSPKLQGLYNIDNDDGRLHPFFNPMVTLPRVENVTVNGLNMLKQIARSGIIGTPKFAASDWLQNLEKVDVGSCDSLESVFDFEGQQLMVEKTHVVKLSKLQRIKLSGLPNLTRVFRCQMQDISIPELQDIDVKGCGKLGNLVASNLIKLLQNLKGVSLENCESIEAVFDFEGLKVMGEDTCAILGKLQDIKLEKLPKLEHVCRQAPKEVYIFQNLGTLRVDDCGSLGYLISSSMAQVLVNLESLTITRCMSMKEVVCKMNEDCGEKKIVFRSLSSITLGHLEKLSLFCSSDQQEFEFPLLEKVSIIQCPEMKTFCYGHLTTEKLHGVDFASGDKPVWKSDLNQSVQHFHARVNQVSFDLKEDGVGDNDAEDIHVPEEGDGDGDEYALCSNKGASSKLSKASLTPLVIHSSPLVADENEELVYSSLNLNLRKDAGIPSNISSTSSPSGERSVHLSSYLPVPSKSYQVLSDSLTSPDEGKSSKILIQGVYVEANMKTTFEDILAAYPNFLSGLRLKMARMKTEIVESAIRSLHILRECTALTISPEQLAYIRDSVDDMEASGLDKAWLERGYQRASLVMKEQKAISASAELARLEREKTEDEAAFEMARAKLEASTARRDVFKAKRDVLMQELEAGKELFRGGFDLETSLGNGLLD